jgi:inosine-uridine nucleoside N-ribohydrolase
MKNRSLYFFIAFVIAVFSCCSSKQTVGVNEKMNVIFETDVGNDVDDALALDMLYKYADAGKINLLGICINKNGVYPAEFVDILNTWYGYNNIPIGVIHNGAECENDATNYAMRVCNEKDDDGKPLYKRSIKNYEELLEASMLYRKILANQPDSSVTIISTGFSTNLSRLLDTKADRYSPLSGLELVSRKVKRLVMMAGCFNNPQTHEYNVVKDIPAAKRIFETWPSLVVTSPFELGAKILYPAESIQNDFKWVDRHPVVDAYKSYMKMPYDRPTWDLTSVLYCVEGSSRFTLSEAGYISVDDNGATMFRPDERGNRYYLMATDEQGEAIGAHLQEIIKQKPKSIQ